MAGGAPGEEMPDFDLPTTDGRRLRKADYVGVRPLLLSFDSVTCPMTADAGPEAARPARPVWRPGRVRNPIRAGSTPR